MIYIGIVVQSWFITNKSVCFNLLTETKDLFISLQKGSLLSVRSMSNPAVQIPAVDNEPLSNFMPGSKLVQEVLKVCYLEVYNLCPFFELQKRKEILNN